MSVLVEHIGDLTHRMSEYVTYDTAGYEFVETKLYKGISYLSSGYGFEREFKENLKNNASLRDETFEELYARTKVKLQEYANAHAQITVYNELQEHARDAAVSIGMLEFDECLYHLQELQRHWDKGVEHWTQKAHEITRN